MQEDLDWFFFFFFQAEDGIRDLTVTGVQTCALPILALGIDCVVSPGSSGSTIRAKPFASSSETMCSTRSAPNRSATSASVRWPSSRISTRRAAGERAPPWVAASSVVPRPVLRYTSDLSIRSSSIAGRPRAAPGLAVHEGVIHPGKQHSGSTSRRRLRANAYAPGACSTPGLPVNLVADQGLEPRTKGL